MRLIDADELITAFPCGESVRTESVRATINHIANHTATDVFKALKEAEYRGYMKAVAERPQGEWIPCTKEGCPLTELGRRESQKWYGYKCSKCNYIYKGNALTESPFCQNCGSRNIVKE